MLERSAFRGLGGVVAVFSLWGSLAVVAPAGALEVPFLSGRINDTASMIPADVRPRLEEKLAALEAEKGSQVAVLTIPSLEGESLEDYSLRVAEAWKLGRGKFDDGALLLIVRDDRKMRLEVGYGLEPALTDAASIRILDDVLRPRFRQGDFGGGVEAAVDAIAGTIRGEDVLPPPSAGDAAEPPLAVRLGVFAFFLAIVGLFSMVAIFGDGVQSWFLYLFLTPFWFAFPIALLGAPFGGLFTPAWLLGFPIARFVLRKTAWGKKLKTTFDSSGSGSRRRRWSSSRGWGSGGFGGGGFSGGGFSGGGGSFGGGGASSSW